MANIKQEYKLKIVADGLEKVIKEIQAVNKSIGTMGTATDKAGKSFDSASKEQDNYSKKAKGVGQLTNNQSKAFSKMAQGMSGTLVPAYATVAANVFALTAAFGALKRAADLQILVDSAEAFAVQTGRSLTGLSKNMQDISNGALTMKESLESASIAASAGFDNSTIKELTQVARNASVALGRDMTDSLNRVFKGAIKAEPELLDELGIILRLDTASRNYAASLGKTANSLTTFEKQQAVVNAVLEQGEEKFGSFSDVDVNPFTQLAASFHDITATLIQIINIPISPVLTFLADNVMALTAVIVLFSASVIKRAFPALSDFANVMRDKLVTSTEAASKALDEAKKVNFSYTNSLKGTTKASINLLKTFSLGVAGFRETVESEGVKTSKAFKKSFSLGTDTVEGLKEYEKGLKGVLGHLKAGRSSQGFKPIDKDAIVEELGEVSNVLNKVSSNVLTMDKKIKLTGSNAALAFTKMKLSVISFGSELARSATSGALRGYTEGFKGVSAALKETAASTTGITKGFSLATTAISGAGGAFLRMLPIIGQVVFAWSLLSSAFSAIKDAMFGKELVDLTETLDSNTEALNTAAKSAVYYNDKLKELPTTLDNVVKKTKLLSNTFSNLSDTLESTLADLTVLGGFGGFDTFLDAFGAGDLDEFKDQLTDITSIMRSFGSEKEANEVIEKFGKLVRLSGDEAIRAGEELLKHVQRIRDTARGTKDLNEGIKESLGALSKGLNQLHGSLPALTGAEVGFFNLNSILSALDAGNVHQVVSAMDDLTQFDLRQLGLVDIADNIASIKKDLPGFEKGLKGAKESLSKLSDERERYASYDDGSGEQFASKTQREFDLLTGTVESYSSAIDEVNKKLAAQSADIVTQLDKVKDRFELIINAQRKIADIRSKNASSNLEQGNGLDKRLSQLNDITEAENSYLITIREQTQNTLSNISKALDATKAKLLTETDDGKKSSLLKERSSYESTQQQLQNKLLADRTKIAGNYIKQVKAIQKELDGTTKAAAAGLTVSKEQSRILQAELYTGFVNIGLAQNLNLASARAYADEMLKSAMAVQNLNKFLLQTRMPSVDTIIAGNTALDARLEKLQIEANFLNADQALNSRIDKELLISQIINDRLIAATENKLADLKDSGSADNSAVVITAQKTLNALNIKALKLEETKTKTIALATKLKLKGMRDELKGTKQILALGIMASKKQLSDLKIQKELQKLTKQGYKDLDEFEKTLQDMAKADYAASFNEGMSSMVDGMSEYGAIIRELSDDLENLGTAGQKFTAGLKAMSSIGEESGNNVTKAFADLGIVVDAYNEKLNAGTMGARDWAAFTSSALGAMAQLYDEGSQSAKNLTALQHILAVVSATIAVLEQGKGDPYTAFARMAAMAASVASLLSSSGIGGFGSSISGASSGEDYKKTIGSQGLVGVDLETVSLTDSIDDLVGSTTALFTIEHELQVAISGLTDVFSQIAASISGTLGTLDTSSFGVTEGSVKAQSTYFRDTDPVTKMFSALDPLTSMITDLTDKFLSAIGFSKKSVSTKVIDSGIQMGASIEALGDSLVGSLTNTGQYLVAEISTKTSSWWGLKSSTSTALKTYYDSLPPTFENALAQALDQTLLVVTDLFRTFGEAVNVDLEKLFSDIGVVDISTLRISLEGKNAEEQSEALAAWFSNMGNDVIAQVVPFIEDYARAGEELLDTLIRITNTTIQLSNAFSTVDLGISAITDTSTINFSVLTDAAAEQLKLEMVAAWQESFTSNFTDMDEFTELFEKFSNAIFSETELLDIAFANSTEVVNAGFEVLRQQLTDTGNFDLLDALGTENTDAALRAVYDIGVETSAFAAVVDSATGEIDTSGADLLTVLIQLGAAIDDQSVAAEALTDVLDNLNEQYERQIALFGLLGKELELLQLGFDFEDALREAEETGTDIALVETLYGLQRLDIIRRYNQEIVDSISNAMNEVDSAILDVLSSATGWNEAAYQSLKIAKLVDKLSDSMTGIDFSIFTDLSETTEFIDALGDFIDISVGSASSIEEQVALVEELQDAIMARYNAEVAANETLTDSILSSIDAIKEFSLEINNFIDDLFVGDISPLTNAQKLAEAQTQFDYNLQNVASSDEALSEAARGDLLDSASTLLELANLFYAVGPEYKAVFNDVVGSLERIDETLLAEVAKSEETLAINALEFALTSLQSETISQLQTLDSILYELEAQNTQNLNDELLGTLPIIAGSLDSILLQLQNISDTSWNPIKDELITLNSTMSTFVSGVGSFATGSEEISYDQLAMVHKGETILNASTANSIRSGEAVFGNPVLAGSDGGDNSDVVDAIRVLTQVVATGQEDILDKNEEIRAATRNIRINSSGMVDATTKGII